MDAFETTLRDRIADVYRNDRWICIATFAAHVARIMEHVAETAGFEAPSDDEHLRSSPLIGLAVHDRDPDPTGGFPILSLDRPSSGDVVADLLETPSAMADLPPGIADELDAWDPDRTAGVLVPPIMTNEPVAGRPVFGGRPSLWAALEDKLAVLDLWAEAGLTTAPAEVVALADRAALVSAHSRLAGPNGTVWAADNRKGMHGGAAGTHWVPSAEAAARVADRLAADHGHVRIMPYLDGVPCSIHGIVLDDATVTSRPNEMLVYLDESEHRFRYCRFSSHWDPPADSRAAMIEAAKAVGRALRTRVGFRGVFSLDGVLTADGFRPTEVNPRYGSALPLTLPIGDGRTINLVMLDRAIIAGSVRPDAARLQSWLVANLDRRRHGGASFATTGTPDETRSGTVVGDADDLTLTGIDTESDDTPPVASVTWLPVGARHRLEISFADAFPVGPPAAPLALRIARLVDREWEVGLEDLVPALALAR
ncbi:MAG: hypothetical protein OES24_14820 [Acidimicrobiia bacterium]|nr:hypothetical protein [Acidimicrobiia bacterium]